jgi:hypothetical protein
MMTSYPQISQITQTVDAEVRLWGYKGFQNRRVRPCSPDLCNLRNLRRKSVEENL